MKQFVATVLIVIGIAMIILRFPSCQPPDVSDCTWDATSKQYDCPNER